jgi:hypothetical protein
MYLLQFLQFLQAESGTLGYWTGRVQSQCTREIHTSREWERGRGREGERERDREREKTEIVPVPISS